MLCNQLVELILPKMGFFLVLLLCSLYGWVGGWVGGCVVDRDVCSVILVVIMYCTPVYDYSCMACSGH